MSNWRRRVRSQRGKGFYYPGTWGRSPRPDYLFGKSYFEYNIGDAGVWQDSPNMDGNSMATEVPVRLRQNNFVQGVGDGSTRKPAFHAIQLNSPIPKYTGIGSWTGAPLSPKWYWPNIQNNGFNNINEGANNFQFLSIYETYLKITALPASNIPEVGETELKITDLNIDSLCIFYMFPNGKDGDAWQLQPSGTDGTGDGLVEPTLAASIANNPINWEFSGVGGVRSASELNRVKGLRKIPLNTPNSIGGGRTVVSAKWKLKGHQMSNASDVQTASSGGASLRYYGIPYDRYSMQMPGQHVNNEWYFYWALGSDFGVASASYQYRFKIQMWTKYKCFNFIERLPNYIGWVRQTQGSVGPSGPENQGPTETLAEKEAREDQEAMNNLMEISDVPETPTTPLINQMFQEFMRIQKSVACSSSSVSN